MEVPSVNVQRIESLKKMKATWQSIIDKYSSFSENDQGDMIDIRTGEIINDKGHLRSLNDPTVKTGNVWTVFLNNDDSVTESDDLNGDEGLLNLGNSDQNNNKNAGNRNTDASTNSNTKTNANTNANKKTSTKSKSDTKTKSKTKNKSLKSKSVKKKDNKKKNSNDHGLIKPKSPSKKPAAKKSKKKSTSKGEKVPKATAKLNNEQLISNQPNLDNGQLISNQPKLISTAFGDDSEYQDSPHFSKRNTSRRLRSEISSPDNLTIVPISNCNENISNRKPVRVRKLWYFPNDELRLVSPTFGSVANDSIQISSLEDRKQNDSEYNSMVSRIPFDLCYSGSRFSPSKVRRFRMSIEKNKQHINNNERSKRLKKLILRYQKIKKPEPNYLVPPLVIDLTNSRSSTGSDIEYPQNGDGDAIIFDDHKNMVIGDEDDVYEEDLRSVPEGVQLDKNNDYASINEENQSDEMESDDTDIDTGTDTHTHTDAHTHTHTHTRNDDDPQAQIEAKARKRRPPSAKQKKIDSRAGKNDNNIAKHIVKTIQNIDSGINNSIPNKMELAQIITAAVKTLTKNGQSDESAVTKSADTKSTENTNKDEESSTSEADNSEDGDSDDESQKEHISNDNVLANGNLENGVTYVIGSEESSSDESDPDVTSGADLPLSSSLRRPIIYSDSESEDDDNSDKEESSHKEDADDSEVEEINIEQENKNNSDLVKAAVQTWDYADPSANRKTMETASNDNNDLIAPLLKSFQQHTLSPSRKDDNISLFVPDDVESDTGENLLNMNVRPGLFSDEESLFVKDQFFDENES